MANHKSAAKRSRQIIKRTIVNQNLLSQIKTSFNKFNIGINEKNLKVAQESLVLFNIALSKAVKKGVIKKKTASRKLSSLSYKLKKIS